jgi:putative peptidoglycan lipid II flippase
MDVFVVAFQIPNFLRRLFAEGAFSQAFVPVLSEYQAKGPHAEVQALADRVAGTLGVVLFFVTLLWASPRALFILLFAPGFAASRQAGARSEMLRFTFPYLFFISLTAFAGGILNTYGKFGVPAFTPVFLNLVLIGAAIWLSPRFAEPIFGLAIGVFIAGVVQLAFQLPFLRAIKLLPRPRWGWKDPGRAQDRQIDAAGDPRFLGGADQPDRRSRHRIVPRYREHQLAVLLGPAA